MPIPFPLGTNNSDIEKFKDLIFTMLIVYFKYS
jgi:hypothetical protein